MPEKEDPESLCMYIIWPISAEMIRADVDPSCSSCFVHVVVIKLSGEVVVPRSSAPNGFSASLLTPRHNTTAAVQGDVPCHFLLPIFH